MMSNLANEIRAEQQMDRLLENREGQFIVDQYNGSGRYEALLICPDCMGTDEVDAMGDYTQRPDPCPNPECDNGLVSCLFFADDLEDFESQFDYFGIDKTNLESIRLC
tara:strand:- start:202 stop:525 length:324 start_codon:yes stop_codon:yes gene_type:complete